ncbi:MAG: LacI family DNA-binding transcriptional regulator [Burkholderiales bacterium]|nr:LacI family DNA-binding transcriptional regulator [Opitutaceae bacterium]
MPAISLRELAVRLDVSHATVSEALRGSPRVKTATRLRIIAEAERLGYRANPLASALMTEMRRSRNGSFRGTLALFDPETSARRSPAFIRHQADLAAGAIERAGQLGFRIDPISLQQRGLSRDTLSDVLHARGINGVLILPACSPVACADLDWSRLCVVRADACAERPVLHAFHPDHHQALSLALDELHARGFTRPGLVLDPALGESALHRWFTAYHAHYLRRHSVLPKATATPPSAPLVAAADESDRLRTWLAREKHDVVLAHDVAVSATLRALHPGPASPPDFCCLCLAADTPQHPGLDLRSAAIGRHAVQFLIDLVLRNQCGVPELPITSLIPAAWRPGSSAPASISPLCA